MTASGETPTLRGRTIVMSGGSRGIGLAIAIAVGRHGANVVLLAKTDLPHPRLPGTVHTAVDAVVDAGGHAVAVVGDVRNEQDTERAASTAIDQFGAIDIVVNNASAIDLSATAALTTKGFDLMHQVNVRGTQLLTRACLTGLTTSDDGRVLTLSPPINLRPRWLGAHPAYTVSKYAMTLLTLGWAEELADVGVSCTCLWPETLIATAAVANVVGGIDGARSPQIMADAAVAILVTRGHLVTGRTLLDTEVLASAGQSDFARYGGGSQPTRDLFVDPDQRLHDVTARQPGPTTTAKRSVDA